jgi:nucleoside-diphosphate-sugar epimerase
MREKSHDPLAEFRRVNTAASLELAVQAAAAGVRRMVFVSTVFVNGLETVGTPFRADDPASPTSPYAVSKHEAELGLREISRTTGMELVIIRPPLVYGPGVRGNFARLVGALRRGVPMPLGAVDNRRSLVGVDNLVDLILRCSWHPNAAQQSFLVSDGEDLSTTELLRRTAHALDRKALLLPIPPAVLRLLAAGLGQHELGRRLLGSLQVDISKTCAMLGWSPPVSLDEGLRRAVSTTTLPASRGVR